MTHSEAVKRALDILADPIVAQGIAFVEEEVLRELLRSPVPDPETGLMPCGCGGKAKIWSSDPTQFTKIVTDYEVGCAECAMTTGWVRGKPENAMKVWNTAMGWRAYDHG